MVRYTEASPCLSLGSSAPISATAVTASFKLEHLFFKPTIALCINGPADSTSPPSSSSSSTGSPWYNPIRGRRKKRVFRTPTPEIIRHWVDADSWIPSHEGGGQYFDLLNIMERVGYAGSYKRRTGDAVDGCAMFWKADKFRLLEGESIEFKRHGLRDNVAQLSVFEMSKAESRRFLVGNIHVLYNPSRGEVKLGQIRTLSSKAHMLSEKWGNVPVVLAGDYNCTPQSAIYEFLSSSELNTMLHERRESCLVKEVAILIKFSVSKEKQEILCFDG